MKKTRIVNFVLIISLCINACFGAYFSTKLFSKNSDSAKNYKYDARLSTFRLNSNEATTVFLGDSITAYVDWNEFFPNSDLLNRGVEGDTWGGYCIV